jgi:hypothetical protein
MSMIAIPLLVALAAPQAEATGAATPQPIEVTVGMFINDIPTVDLQGSSFAFDAYIWFRWDPKLWPPKLVQKTEPARSGEDDELGPAGTFEIVGASADLTCEPVYSSPGYCCVQVKGERHTLWDVQDFPFDRQELSIVIEDASFDTRELVYRADVAGSGYGKHLQIVGFRPQPVRNSVSEFTYETTFGDPTLTPGDASPYSRYTCTIPLHRDSWGLFLKLFSGLFVCTAIAMVSLFIQPTQVDPRFGLGVGALFGIVGSSYLVSSLLPDGSELCYADKLHVLGLYIVLLVVVESAMSLALTLRHGERGERLSRRLDRTCFVILACCLAGVSIWLTMEAIGPGATS